MVNKYNYLFCPPLFATTRIFTGGGKRHKLLATPQVSFILFLGNNKRKAQNMVYDVLNFLWEKHIMEYAFWILIVWLIGHYTLPYAWKIRQELKEIKQKEFAAAEQKRRKKAENAAKLKQRKNLPSYCPKCKKNIMVRIGASTDSGIISDIYKCPDCFETKYVVRDC